MRNGISLVLILLGFSVSASAIELRGVSPDHLKTLRRDIPSIFLVDPTASEMDAAIKWLYATEEYDQVQISELNGRPILEAQAIKRIDSVIVQGASALSESEVRSLLRLPTEERFDSQKLSDAVDRVQSRYLKIGYLGAKVSGKPITTDRGAVQVLIMIDEGSPCSLGEVKFTTNNGELQKALNKIAKGYRGQPLDEDLLNNLNQDIKTYFADNRYLITTVSTPEVQYTEDKRVANVSYSIERPFKFVLYIEGNVFFERSQILREISVNSQNPTGANPSAELAERIKALYLRKGFATVEVAFAEQVSAQSFTRTVTFNIKEGPRVRVKDIVISGERLKTKDFYLDFLDDHSDGIHTYGYYSREDLDKSLNALIFELQNQGFLKAEIKSTRVDYSKKKDYVTIDLNISEGPQTLIEKITFDGNASFSDDQLRQVTSLHPKEPLSLRTLEASIGLLQNHYTEHGYLDMQVSTPQNEIVTYSADNTRAEIKFDIYEGPQVRVAAIAVEGNEKTIEDVVIRELEFEVGDILTPTLINDSIYRLQKLQLFSEVSISTLERGTQIAERTVIVRVSERFPGAFTSGIGLNSEFDLTVRGYLGVGYRNLGGTARGLTGRIELKRVTDIDFMDHRLTTGYLEPHLFKSRTRGIVNLTRSYSIKKRDRAKDQVIATDTNELELLLEREFFRYLKVGWNLWSIASIIDFEIDDKVPSESQVIATIGPSVEWDSRDNPFNASRGIFARINNEYSDPVLGSSRKIKFTRTNAVISHYLPLKSTRWVWANSVRGGFIRNLDPEGILPATKLFNLGGRSTVRGFDTGEIPRRADNLRPIRTESHFYLVKSEFRFPIWGDFGAVVFYDGGAVKILDETIEPEYRDAVGLGFRYNTPVGPVSAEYGHKLNRQKDAGESEGRFHFSIGAF